ncbi:hypothetical protein SK128_007968, partial [Halocaridina rubra]
DLYSERWSQQLLSDSQDWGTSQELHRLPGTSLKPALQMMICLRNCIFRRQKLRIRFKKNADVADLFQ